MLELMKGHRVRMVGTVVEIRDTKDGRLVGIQLAEGVVVWVPEMVANQRNEEPSTEGLRGDAIVCQMMDHRDELEAMAQQLEDREPVDRAGWIRQLRHHARVAQRCIDIAHGRKHTTGVERG